MAALQMPDTLPENRTVDGRVTLPVEQEGSRSSLIPDDVWELYQQEVAEQEREESERYRVEVASSELVALRNLSPEEALEFVSVESEIGLSSVIPIEPDEARKALRRVSLFEALSEASLDALLGSARQGELNPGEQLFVEGDVATSFFVVLEGTVEIFRIREEREVPLRQMKAGELIGLLGLFSGKLRAASARAVGPVKLLELTVDGLNALLSHDAELHGRLVRFYRERLLEGFFGSSLLFSEVEPAVRQQVLLRCTEKHLSDGETLLQPGEVTNLLAVVVSGRLVLEHRPRPGQQPQLFEVLPGQYIAVVSAMNGAPSRMRIFGSRDATVVMVGQRELAEVLKDHPSLRTMARRLPTVARTLDRDVYCGHTGVPGL